MQCQRSQNHNGVLQLECFLGVCNRYVYVSGWPPATLSGSRLVEDDGMADDTDDVLDNWEDEDAEVRLFMR